MKLTRFFLEEIKRLAFLSAITILIASRVNKADGGFFVLHSSIITILVLLYPLAIYIGREKIFIKRVCLALISSFFFYFSLILFPLVAILVSILLASLSFSTLFSSFPLIFYGGFYFSLPPIFLLIFFILPVFFLSKNKFYKFLFLLVFIFSLFFIFYIGQYFYVYLGHTDIVGQGLRCGIIVFLTNFLIIFYIWIWNIKELKELEKEKSVFDIHLPKEAH